MQREFDTTKPPDRLIELFAANQHVQAFRRRAILAQDGHGKWELAGCSIDLCDPEAPPAPRQSLSYPRARLHEDFLTGGDCELLARALHQGHIQIGDLVLEQSQNPQWSTEFLPLENHYMHRAGYVVSLRFSTTNNRVSVGPLLVPHLPYYPDINEAAQDWLPFKVHHGDGDGKRDGIVFLLPQTHAYFSNVTFPEDGLISIETSGTEIGRQPFKVKGAYWRDRRIHQLDVAVGGGKALLPVPEDAERLEYFLIGSGGTTYDFQREDRFGHSGLGRRRVGSPSRNLLDQIQRACLEAEGPQVEFKPFFDPSQPLVQNRQLTKFGEVVKTVVAFTNAEGGRIYVGIDDDCTVVGINQDLSTWAESSADDAAVQSYVGSVHNTLKARINGDIVLRFSHTLVDDMIVVVVDVSPGERVPVTMQGDAHLYVRTGPNNRKVPPQEWLSSQRNEDSLKFVD
jgi:hypothetical protein